MNFTKGEEIIGVFGRSDRDSRGITTHFVSLGFILNQCNDDTLAEFSRNDPRIAERERIATEVRSRRESRR